MKRFWRQREWLSMSEAVQYLAEVTGDNVEVADLLRLALDKQLTLSVYLPVKTKVRCAGKVDGAGDQSRTWTRIEGLWDLSMEGAGRAQVAHEYHRATNRPFISLERTDGAWVERDGVRCQLEPVRGSSGMWPTADSALSDGSVLGVRVAALDALVAETSRPAPVAQSASGLVGAEQSKTSQVPPDELAPFDITAQDLETKKGRVRAVDAFLAHANNAQPHILLRTHIWKAAGYKFARSFEYWQQMAPTPKATRACDENVRRILAMSVTDFLDLLRRQQLIEDRDASR